MSSPLLFAVIASFHGPALRSGAVHGPVFHGSLTLAKKNTVTEEKLYAGGMYLVCKTPLPLLNIIPNVVDPGQNQSLSCHLWLLRPGLTNRHSMESDSLQLCAGRQYSRVTFLLEHHV